jgi:hypothetical protein
MKIRFNKLTQWFDNEIAEHKIEYCNNDNID